MQRLRPHKPLYPDSKRGKADEMIWRLIVRMAVASNKCDELEYLRAFGELANEYTLASHRLAGAFIKFLLRRQLNLTIGISPTAEEMHQLADEIRPRFHLVLPKESQLLELLFAAAYERGEPDAQVRAGRFTFLGMATLGVLVDDATKDLAAARPDLERWCAQRADFLRQMCESPEIRAR